MKKTPTEYLFAFVDTWFQLEMADIDTVVSPLRQANWITSYENHKGTYKHIYIHIHCRHYIILYYIMLYYIIYTH